MLNIVLFGAPGCGKGTQAAKMKEHYEIDHVSTGEVIRSEIHRETELGLGMKECIAQGKLVPDQLVIDIVKGYVKEHCRDNGNIFDGFPRTIPQAEAFDEMLAEVGLTVDLMVYMDVPEEELVRRIVLRGKESGRSDDASEEVIRHRIETYRQQTAVVADYYAKQGKYVAVNGLGTVDEVFERIVQAIDSHRK